MKKILIALLVFILTFSLVSCYYQGEPYNDDEPYTPPPPTANSVERSIEQLDLSYASYLQNTIIHTGGKISIVRREYEALDDEQKNQVENYNKLLYAESLYTYFDLQDDAERNATSDIKATLKNPSSLQIHSQIVSFYYDANYEKPLLILVITDYSAQNGFGGMNRKTVNSYYSVEKGDSGVEFLRERSYDFFSTKKDELGAQHTVLGDLKDKYGIK